MGSAANEGSSAMAAASSGGEADELIGEGARSVVSEANDERKRTKRGKRAGRQAKTGGDREVAERRRRGVNSGEQLPSG